jgi:hypothetical protein
LLWLLWKWGLVNFCLSWPHTGILLISASQEAWIIGVSHQHPALFLFFFCGSINDFCPWVLRT